MNQAFLDRPPPRLLRSAANKSKTPSSSSPPSFTSPSSAKMQHLLRLRRSIHSAAAFAAGRALSTAAPPSRPRWAMIFHAEAARSSPAALRASFQLAEPPRASNLHVPAHLLDLRPLTDPRSQMRLLGGCVRGASVDGLLLLDFSDGLATGPVVGVHPDGLARQFTGFDKRFDVTRFVCNPITGQLFRMPDIDGTKDTSWCQFTGILTQSDRPDGPPDRYAVAWLSVNDRDDNRRIALRRFLSQRGEWDKPVGLPSPLPLARRMDVTHEVVAFAGRLWWVDVSWGAVSVDPFSDRPELQFVELPRGSVTEPVEEGIRKLGRFRRVGVSEGRLRYAEVSQKQPFVLSSFALDDNGSSWTLEHRVALSRLGVDGCHTDPEEDDTPRIGVIDPLNASTMYLTIGDSCVSVDMERGEVLGRSQIGCSTGPFSPFSGFLTPCVLPPWLGEFQIPSAGTLSSTKANIRSKTMADTLVRVDRDMKS